MSLFVACESGDVVEVQRLLNGLDKLSLSERDDHGCTPLHIACARGNIEVVKLLLDLGANFEWKDYNGTTCLHYACAYGQVDVVKILIERGVNNWEMKNEPGLTPLSVACKHGNVQLVRLLIQQGSNLEVKDNDDFTLLHLASFMGHFEVVKLLIDRKSNLINEKSKTGYTPLHLSCSMGHVKIVEYLIALKVNLEEKDKRDQTALHFACKNGNVDIVEMLINQAVNLEEKTNSGYTPLHLACENGHLKVAELLINQKVNLEDTDNADCMTPLHLACCNGYEDVVKCFIDESVNLESKDKYGCTPLALACKYGHFKVAQLLINRGANLIHLNEDSRTHLDYNTNEEKEAVDEIDLGMTIDIYSMRFGDFNFLQTNEIKLDQSPLHLTFQGGHLDIAQLLIEKGATLEKKNTLLLLACAYGHVQVVKLLLDKGAKLEAQYDRWTPFAVACAMGRVDVAKLLIERGLHKLRPENNNVYTPLHLSCFNGHLEIVQLLKNLNENFEGNNDNEDQKSALHLACENGNEQIVETLIINQTIKIKDQSSAETEFVFHQNVNLESKDKYGCTPLALACKYGHFKVAQLLINRGANFKEATDDSDENDMNGDDEDEDEEKEVIEKIVLEMNGMLITDCTTTTDNRQYNNFSLFLQNNKIKLSQSPLHLTFRGGHLDIAQLLIEKGATLEKKNTLLLLACAYGHVQVVKLLLDKGAKLEARFDRRTCWTPFVVACAFGKVDVAKVLIERGANLDPKDVYNQSHFYFACKGGSVEIAKLLIDRNKNIINERYNSNSYRRTPLHVACGSGNVELVRLLLDYGANLEDTTTDGLTPLLLACLCGHVGVASLLLNRGACLEAKDIHHQTPLHFVCGWFTGSVELAKILIYRGAQLEEKDNKFKATPLHLACENGYREIVKLFIDQKVNLEKKAGLNEMTPLHLACKNGYREIVKLFIDQKVNLEEKAGLNELTPLHLACEKGYREIVELFIDQKVNLEEKAGLNELTSLHFACVSGHAEVAELLIDHGVNLDIKTCGFNLIMDETPLHLACRQGHVKVVRLLTSKNVDLENKNADGQTPLHLACLNGKLDVVKVLIEKGVNIQEKDVYGNTALHITVEREELERFGPTDDDRASVLRCLLDTKTIDPNSTNKQDKTAFEIAFKNGFTKCAELLPLVPTAIPTSVTMSILSIKFQSWKISAAAANAGKMKTLDSPSLIIKKKLIDYPNVDCSLVVANTNNRRNTLAFQLLSAIKTFQLAEIERLVCEGEDQNLLTVTDQDGNTFLHFVTLLMDFEFLHFTEWTYTFDKGLSPQIFQIFKDITTKHPEIAKDWRLRPLAIAMFLIQNGCDWEARNSNGYKAEYYIKKFEDELNKKEETHSNKLFVIKPTNVRDGLLVEILNSHHKQILLKPLTAVVMSSIPTLGNFSIHVSSSTSNTIHTFFIDRQPGRRATITESTDDMLELVHTFSPAQQQLALTSSTPPENYNVDEAIPISEWRIEKSQKRDKNGSQAAVLVDPLGGRYTREGKRWRCTTKCTTKQVIVKMGDDGIYRLKGQHDSANCKHHHGENQFTSCPIPTEIQAQLKSVV